MSELRKQYDTIYELKERLQNLRLSRLTELEEELKILQGDSEEWKERLTLTTDMLIGTKFFYN